MEISSASQIQSFDLSRVHAGRGGWLLLDPQNITIDLKRSAMVVIDMQNDFCAEGGWVDALGLDYTDRYFQVSVNCSKYKIIQLEKAAQGAI